MHEVEVLLNYACFSNARTNYCLNAQMEQNSTQIQACEPQWAWFGLALSILIVSILMPLREIEDSSMFQMRKDVG